MELQQSRSAPLQDRIKVWALKNRHPVPCLADDVRNGLTAIQKYLPPKYFYDERGSWLYDKICEVPEYYPARVEEALLAESALAIIEQVQPGAILEFGSGTSRKTEYLLNACEQLACYAKYFPLDVCQEMLLVAGQRLLREYDWLDIRALVGDYSTGILDLPERHGPRLFVFLGGTVGNFHEDEALRFLRELRGIMSADDWFLLGVDRVKDRDVLHAAYNDSQGYTAAFNLNVLQVINRELDGQFQLDRFVHRASYNEEHSRIEMHLHSTVPQTVRIDALDMDIPFNYNESIHTEVSRKFTLDSMIHLVEQGGFTLAEHFEPKNCYFSLALLRPKD